MNLMIYLIWLMPILHVDYGVYIHNVIPVTTLPIVYGTRQYMYMQNPH